MTNWCLTLLLLGMKATVGKQAPDDWRGKKKSHGQALQESEQEEKEDKEVKEENK